MDAADKEPETCGKTLFEQFRKEFELQFEEIPEAERENAISGNCWIDERNMDPTEPRKGTRFFTIDIKQIKWSFYFRT